MVRTVKAYFIWKPKDDKVCYLGEEQDLPDLLGRYWEDFDFKDVRIYLRKQQAEDRATWCSKMDDLPEDYAWRVKEIEFMF